MGAVATFFVGRWWGKWRAKRDFARKEFRDRFNFSLNALDDGTLRIRTLRECNLEDIWFNAVMRERLRAVADTTTPGDPILAFTDEERWHFLNVVLNEVSEMCSGGLLRADMGVPHTKARYIVCLTNEKDGDMKTWKIRAMVVREDILPRVLSMHAAGEEPIYESPHHATRWRTLRVIARRHEIRPDHMMTMDVVA